MGDNSIIQDRELLCSISIPQLLLYSPKKKCYNADVIIESISGDITTAKIVNARNFCDKEYNGTENYSFELNTNGYELSENEKYNVVVECVDNNYILKFVYESDI